MTKAFSYDRDASDAQAILAESVLRGEVDKHIDRARLVDLLVATEPYRPLPAGRALAPTIRAATLAPFDLLVAAGYATRADSEEPAYQITRQGRAYLDATRRPA